MHKTRGLQGKDAKVVKDTDETKAWSEKDLDDTMLSPSEKADASEVWSENSLNKTMLSPSEKADASEAWLENSLNKTTLSPLEKADVPKDGAEDDLNKTMLSEIEQVDVPKDWLEKDVDDTMLSPSKKADISSDVSADISADELEDESEKEGDETMLSPPEKTDEVIDWVDSERKDTDLPKAEKTDEVVDWPESGEEKTRVSRVETVEVRKRKVPEETVRLLRAHWQEIGFDVETARFNARGALQRRLSEADEAAVSLDSLPRVVIAQRDDTLPRVEPPDLQIGTQIGLGGMAIVEAALQVPLQREVALKRLRPERSTTQNQLALLREARITGRLEHPNIVPIHVLGCDQRSSPFFVMKRIEGVPWSQLMNDAEHPLRREDGRDHLEWNLRILVQVCNAVAFAHNKGILHRDLKPANVMIGPFGEVYVLDWGLAIEWKEGKVLLPDGEDPENDIVGTPFYMAPEMVMGRSNELSQATDIFLLGAILYEIVMGEPPHKRGSVEAALLSAYDCEPLAFSKEIPRELIEICKKSTQKDPKQRYLNVEELRRALSYFLQHRHSLVLCDEAQIGLALLQEIVALPSEEQPDEMRVHGLFLEAQFGFQQALKAWDKNLQAQSGLADLRETMARYEIGRENEQAAAMWMAQLESPSVALRTELLRLRQKRKEKAERWEHLERFAQDHDIQIGQRLRSFLVLLLTAIYSPFLFLFSESGGRLFGRQGPLFLFDTRAFVLFGGLFFGWTAVATLSSRKAMLQNRANRSIIVSLWGLGTALFVLPWGCLLLGIPAREGFAITSLLYALTIGGYAGHLDRRLVWPALLFLLNFFGSALWVRWIFEWKLLTDLLALSYIAYLWRPRHPKAASAPAKG